MLEQEIPSSSSPLMELINAEVDYLLPKIIDVYEQESSIDPDKSLYLFTWSPNPEEIPDSDFNTQHLFCAPFIADYLLSCGRGIACVESTQLGNPHYHGWYQLSDDPLKERQRLIHIKCLKRFGMVKITSSIGHYKINSYVAAANCLHYYKKDMLQSMAWVELNPICSYHKINMDWNQHSMLFTKKGRESVADIEDRINLRDFYKEFYANSL